MTTLAKAVDDFLRRFMGGECIDDLPLTLAQQGEQRADYFLRDRSIIVEVKEMCDSRVERARAVLDQWRTRPSWPLVYGKVSLRLALANHPERDRINSEIFDAITKSVEGAFEKANRQIRETRQAFAAPDAHGLLFLLNDSADLLDPSIFVATLNRMFTKRSPDGSHRYPDIDSALVVTWAHSAIDDAGRLASVILSMAPERPRDETRLESVESLLMEQWARFQRAPIERRAGLRNVAEIEAMRFRRKRGPPTI